MSHLKFIRRTFLAAALTMSGVHATTASGFQQGQYQPGEPGRQIPQGNSTVTQELNRMFQESGQQMPSMNPKELPNANVPTQGQIGPHSTPNQQQVNANSANHAQTKQTGTGGKQSVLGRFFGKFRGDTGNNNPDYQPPVPPDDNPAAQSTATAGKMPQHPQGQNSSPQQGQLPQNGAHSDTVSAGHPGKRTMAQGAQGSTPSSAQVHNGAASPIPPRSGATVRAANAENSSAPTSNVVGERTEYVQPGSAPGFMSTAGAAKVIQKQPVAAPSSRNRFQDDFIRDNTGEIAGTQQKAGISTSELAVKKTAADAFESPFRDAAESLEGTEALDLDSLIEIPAATPQPVTAVAKKLNPLEPETSEATGVESTVAPEENPFTGVQLNTSDAEFLDNEGQTTGVDAGSFGAAAAPMEDFNSNLPAIELPAVDLPPVDDEAAAGVDLIATPAADSMQPTEVKTQAKSSNSGNAARTELQPKADVSEATNADIPEAMSAAETTRLRQTAEQERRQLQQRQIQARAGQTGFKGFCPVALRERRELVESSDQFTSSFGLQTYAFSSAESKSAFDTDPSRYAPAAGGSDVVVLVNSGEEQAGQLDYALWYRDRLYLFRSRETMTLFSKDPQRFASQY